MPFRVEERGRRVYRCARCGRLTTSPILLKTCCMNRPMPFCSRECARAWVLEWMRRQEQVVSRSGGRGGRGFVRL